MESGVNTSRSVNKPIISAIGTARSTLSNSSSVRSSSEWFCHCCSARNYNELLTCRVCGRPVTYADGPHLPLHDLGRYVLRSNQVETLLPNDHIHDVNERKWTALHSCASIGNHELVSKLLELGSEIEATTIEGYTPLHLAVYSGSLDTVAILCGKKCNLNPQTFFELNTPLHIAVQEGWRTITQYLIGAGANIKLVNALGRTPLHIAAIHGRIDIGHYLLENNYYSVQTKDGTGWSLQQLAEYYGHYEFEELCQRYLLTDNQYKIREIQRGDYDCQLWRDVVNIKRKNDEKLHHEERAYSVRDILSSRREEPFLLSSTTSESSQNHGRLTLNSLPKLGSDKYGNKIQGSDNDTILSPLSVSTSRSYQQSLNKSSYPTPKYAAAAQRNLNK